MSSALALRAPLRAVRMHGIRTMGSAPACEELERSYLVGTYSADGVRTRKGLCFARGEGTRLFDEEGRGYLDFAAGIAVNSLGHSPPEWVERVQEQATQLAHVSNLFHTRPPLRVAERLVKLSSFDRVFLCNSGTEANEAALKFARRVALAKSGSAASGPASCACDAGQRPDCVSRDGTCECWGEAPSRTAFVAFRSGFHGRSMGSLSITHKPAIRAPFVPMLASPVYFLPYNDARAVRELLRSPPAGVSFAGVFVEPVQGEGGVRPATKDFMHAVREGCDEAGALMVVDEVQCGVGRSGRMWAHDAYDVKPDIMTLAKPLANGLPIGAVLVREAVAAAIRPSDHGSTYAGGPLVAAAAEATLDIIARPSMLEHVRVVGARLHDGLLAMQRKYPALVRDVRAPLDRGLMQALELTKPIQPLVQSALERGVIFITAGPNVLRLVPPLVVSEGDVDEALAAIDHALATAY